MYGRDYGPEADWWNVGILIMEMLTAENPMRGELVLLLLYTWHTTLCLCARIHGWDVLLAAVAHGVLWRDEVLLLWQARTGANRST